MLPQLREIFSLGGGNIQQCGQDEQQQISRAPAALQYEDLQVREEDCNVTLRGRPVELTDTEYALLLLFLKHRGKIFSAQQLYEAVWQEPYYAGANNTVMVHIRNLRKKIEDDPANPGVIKTVWGRGYRCD